MGYAFSNCSEQLASSSKLSPRKKLFSSQGVFRFSVVGWVNGCVSCVLHYAAHLPASSALQKQWGLCSKARIAPATLLLDVCGVCLLFFLLNTLLREHCLSLEKATVLFTSLFPTSHSLHPPPASSRSETDLLPPLCRWELSHREVK